MSDWSPAAPAPQQHQARGRTHDVWRWVDGVLRMVQTDEKLTEAARELVLTSDRQLDEQQSAQFRARLTARMASEQSLMSMDPNIVGRVLALAYDELIGISVLGPLWRDPDVTEILVDAWDKIRVEKGGMLWPTDISFRDPEHGLRVARDMAAKVSDRALTPAQPYVTAELPGARVTLLIDRIVKSGLSISMRKFRPLMGMRALLDLGALTPEMAHFLADCVRAQANVLISGGTGTGKTTFINALAEAIPKNERVVSIEDAYELSLPIDNWVALQSLVKASADDRVRVSLADLLVQSLRMRPDRIIVGEIREPNAAAVMLEAANTGHDGTMTTLHASSVARAVNFRLANWIRTGAQMPAELAIAEIADAFQLVVQIRRDKRSGTRYIQEIACIDVANIVGGVCRETKLWVADRAWDAATEQVRVTHRRVNAVDPASELGQRLYDIGAEQWFIPPQAAQSALGPGSAAPMSAPPASAAPVAALPAEPASAPPQSPAVQ